MIKLVAFDIVGVLAHENDCKLNNIDTILESFFGENNSDREYVEQVKALLAGEEEDILESAGKVIDNIYSPQNINAIDSVKKVDNSIIVVIASNHISYIRKWLEKNINLNNVNKIYVSAEMGVSKPEPEFYKAILREQNVKPKEMLMIDDQKRNIDGANEAGVNTIWYNKKDDLSQLVMQYLNSQK